MATASAFVNSDGGMMDLCPIKATFYTEGDHGTMEVRSWTVGMAIDLAKLLPEDKIVIGGVLILEGPQKVHVSAGIPPDGSQETADTIMQCLVRDIARQIDEERDR